jgi:hypothetical protein
MGVFKALLDSLQLYDMIKTSLSPCLVSVSCDAAAVMLACNSGVAKLLRDEFPSVIVWHCANHRLELSTANTVKAVTGTNKFRAFMDKLCVFPRHSFGVLQYLYMKKCSGTSF